MSSKIKLTKGFTLVELSIVIIIIGLLIVGVVSANSLVEAARLNAVINEFKSHQLSYIGFTNHYNAVPGDMENAGAFWPSCTTNPSKCNGDGNGYVQYDNSVNLQFLATNDELVLAWRHLNLSGWYVGAGTANSYYDSAQSFQTMLYYYDITFPHSSFGDNAFFMLIGSHEPFYPNTFSTWGQRNVIYLVNPGWSGYPILTTNQAQALDQKTDDGNAITGDFRSLPEPARVLIGEYYDCYDASGNYNFANDKVACIFSFAMPENN